MALHPADRSSPGDVVSSIRASIANGEIFDEPYRHNLLTDVLPGAVATTFAELDLAAPALDGASGTREAHNATRFYVDPSAMVRFPVMARLAEALQSSELAGFFVEAFGAALDATYLRIEYAQDVNGFWLEPHTDLGVKKLTILLYLSNGPGHADLGTDLYWSRERHFGRSPFQPNAALVFVPGANTWHGFEKRPIEGIRRSLIVNYVTPEWRAREQLPFPDQLIRL
jgi:hypothetical protein